MEKNIYIVTGATGFVGGVLVKKMLYNNETVFAFARNKEKATLVLGTEFENPNLHLFYGDTRNLESLEKCFEMASSFIDNSKLICIHTAAIVELNGKKKQKQIMQDININGTKNCIDLCLKYNSRMVFVSSVHAIPELKKNAVMREVSEFCPKLVRGAYSKTKAITSGLVLDAVKENDLDAVLVHPSGISGPGDFGGSMLTQMVKDYMAKRIPAATKGGFNFVDIRDVVDGIIKAAVSPSAKSGECYLLTNRFYSVKSVLDMLYEITSVRKIKRTLPLWVAKIGLPFLTLGAKIKKRKPLYTSYALYAVGSNSNYSNEKAISELGYSARGLKETLKDTVEFLKENEML